MFCSLCGLGNAKEQMNGQTNTIELVCFDCFYGPDDENAMNEFCLGD